MNINPSLNVEVFLTLKATGANAPELTNVLTQELKVNQVMHIGHGTDNQKLQFQYSLAEGNLNSIIAVLSENKYSVREVFIHFPSAISGIHDNYHSATAVALEEALLKITEIIDVSISANGIVKIETNAFIQDQNAAVLAAFETIKTNLSQSNT